MEFNYAKKAKNSYPTYLFERGGDQRFIQELLGLNSSKITVTIVIGIYPCQSKEPPERKKPIR